LPRCRRWPPTTSGYGRRRRNSSNRSSCSNGSTVRRAQTMIHSFLEAAIRSC
jgi:hypothetical protein